MQDRYQLDVFMPHGTTAYQSRLNSYVVTIPVVLDTVTV
jgi:hypothetical protein